MSRKGAEEARAELPSLLDAAERGETTLITRRGRPVAALVPSDRMPIVSRQYSLLGAAGTGKGLWEEEGGTDIATLRNEWDR
jgi:prevent-host-death family protein